MQSDICIRFESWTTQYLVSCYLQNIITTLLSGTCSVDWTNDMINVRKYNFWIFICTERVKSSIESFHKRAYKYVFKMYYFLLLYCLYMCINFVLLNILLCMQINILFSFFFLEETNYELFWISLFMYAYTILISFTSIYIWIQSWLYYRIAI